MMVMISIGRDYVSELQPPTGLLVIYEHGEPWWVMSGKTPDLSNRALWQSYQQHPVAKQEELAKEIMNSALRSISFILRRVL
jgi:hypothetical protein